MKILFIENTAGVPYRVSKALCELGHESKVMETWRSIYSFGCDIENYYGSPGKITEYPNTIRSMRKTISIAKDYDIIHVNSGMNWKRFEYPFLGYYHKIPMVIHYCGSDTRVGYGMAYQGLAKAKTVSTPDLLKWHPEAILLLNPIKKNNYLFTGEKIRIVHMPTNRKKKGTELVLRAIEVLKKEKLDFEFVLVEGRTHEEAMKELEAAHILIDQVVTKEATKIAGVIGNCSLEAMSMGKAAVSYIDQEMLPHYNNIPLINAEPNLQSLTDNLRMLIKDPELCREVGIRSQEFVRKYHSPLSVAKKCEAIYTAILQNLNNGPHRIGVPDGR